MIPKRPVVETPTETAVRLQSSIAQVSDHRLELTALGLDQARHQPTPLQNQLLAAACTNLEAWVEIQKTKLSSLAEEVHRQGGWIVPEYGSGPAYFPPGSIPQPSCRRSIDPPAGGAAPWIRSAAPPTPEVSS
jgi:hypothetical protein